VFLINNENITNIRVYDGIDNGCKTLKLNYIFIIVSEVLNTLFICIELNIMRTTLVTVVYIKDLKVRIISSGF